MTNKEAVLQEENMSEQDISVAEMKVMSYKARESLEFVLDYVGELPEPYSESIISTIKKISISCKQYVRRAKSLLEDISSNSDDKEDDSSLDHRLYKQYRMPAPGKKLT